MTTHAPFTGETCIEPDCGRLLIAADKQSTMPEHCVFCRREADEKANEMNTKPNDGGPAFPEVSSLDYEGRPASVNSECSAFIETRGGMSLRAYFAGQAMQSLVTAYMTNDSAAMATAGGSIKLGVSIESGIASAAVAQADASGRLWR